MPFCIKCGYKNKDGAEFCYQCGAPMKEQAGDEISEKAEPAEPIPQNVSAVNDLVQAIAYFKPYNEDYRNYYRLVKKFKKDKKRPNGFYLSLELGLVISCICIWSPFILSVVNNPFDEKTKILIVAIIGVLALGWWVTFIFETVQFHKKKNRTYRDLYLLSNKIEGRYRGFVYQYGEKEIELEYSDPQVLEMLMKLILSGQAKTKEKAKTLLLDNCHISYVDFYKYAKIHRCVPVIFVEEFWNFTPSS